jgi:TP901-1 family phage major tail protein
MAAQRGRDLLVKVQASDSAPFETLAGLRATRIALSAGAAEATSADAPGRWRELLAGAGTQAVAITGRGVFRDAAADATLRAIFFDGATPRFEVVIPDFGTLTGPFLVSGLEYAGTHDGEATYEVSLESAGAIVFGAL